MNKDNSFSKNIAKRYEAICNEYLVAFCANYELEYTLIPEDVWVANEAGTIACIGDYFFDFYDVIKWSVDNDLHDWQTLIQWYDYTIDAFEFNLPVPNFKSWCKGYDKVSEEQIQRLRQLKKNLEEEIDNCKKKNEC